MPTQRKMARPRKEVDQSTYEGRFAARLKALRVKAGLSVDETAERIGVTPGTIYHWETAHSFPKPGQFSILAEALNLKNVRTLFPEK